MSESPTVVVAMSGGVDSSVAAAILVERGFKVIGMMLRLWSEPGSEETNRCCTPDAMAQARRVAGRLKIPFYVVDAKEAFKDIVVQTFISGYSSGITPNPCLECNKQIRWGLLYEEALRMGADYLSTGHYARLSEDEHGWKHLLRGVDAAKDQSYVLSVLRQDHLRHSLFPIGEFTKAEVREMARKWGMIVADRPDSQDLCFLAGGNYREFLSRHQPGAFIPGEVVDMDGNVLGFHQGLANYTIGQRKGLGVSSPDPLYVIAKDVDNHRLVVTGAKNLGKQDFKITGMNWLLRDPLRSPMRVSVKIRYKAREVPSWIQPESATIISVHVDEPLRDITPGQQAVFYLGETCLGGGIISYQGVTP